MAIFAPSVSVATRGKAASPVAASAYIARMRLALEASRHNDRAVYDYTHAHEHERIVADLGVALPDEAPERFIDRETLWNEVEASESRANSQLYRRIMIPLPDELDDGQAVELARTIVADRVADGHIVDAAVHCRDGFDELADRWANESFDLIADRIAEIANTEDYLTDEEELELDALISRLDYDDIGEVAERVEYVDRLSDSYKRFTEGRSDEELAIGWDLSPVSALEPHRNVHLHMIEPLRPTDGNGFLPKSVCVYTCRDVIGREREFTAPELKEAEERGENWQKVYKYGEHGLLTRDEAIAQGLDPIKDRKNKQPLSATRYTTNWNDKDRMEVWREQWATRINEALERARVAERVDHRSYERQGIDRTPMIHEGPQVTAIEREAQARAIKEERPYEPVTDVRRDNVAIRELNVLERLREVVERAIRAIERTAERYVGPIIRGWREREVVPDRAQEAIERFAEADKLQNECWDVDDKIKALADNDPGEYAVEIFVERAESCGAAFDAATEAEDKAKEELEQAQGVINKLEGDLVDLKQFAFLHRKQIDKTEEKLDAANAVLSAKSWALGQAVTGAKKAFDALETAERSRDRAVENQAKHERIAAEIKPLQAERAGVIDRLDVVRDAAVESLKKLPEREREQVLDRCPDSPVLRLLAADRVVELAKCERQLTKAEKRELDRGLGYLGEKAMGKLWDRAGNDGRDELEKAFGRVFNRHIGSVGRDDRIVQRSSHRGGDAR